MTIRRAAIAGSLSAALLALVVIVAGCTPSAAGSRAPAIVGPSAPAQTSSVAGTPSAPSIAATTVKAPVGPRDLRSMQNQLDAMQKELDRLQMPSDKDFNGAAGAVY